MRSTSRRDIIRSLGAVAGGQALLQQAAVAAAAPASVATMRITKYDVMPTRVPFAERLRDAWIESYKLQGRFQSSYEPVFVRVYTDEGLTGIGEALMPAARAEAALKKIVGRSPWEFLQDDSIGGVLMALYDVLGKATGLPACRLMSPAPKSRIFHTYWSHCLPPKLMASEAKRAADLGYRVHKVKARAWQDPIEQAAAICAVVPKDYRVWADANSYWSSPSRALFFIRKLADFHNYFAVESPIEYRSVLGFRALKGNSPLAIAEHMGSEPMEFVREGLVQAFVIGTPVGKTLTQRAMMAEVTGIPLWVEYGTDSAISLLFQAHHAAAFPGIEYTITVSHCLEDDFMVEPLKMDNGYLTMPRTPGLGVTLDEAAVDKYRVRT